MQAEGKVVNLFSNYNLLDPFWILYVHLTVRSYSIVIIKIQMYTNS